MAEIAITAKKTIKVEGQEDNNLEATILYDFGDNLSDAVDKFGEEIVFGCYAAASKISGQAAIRRQLENGKTQEDITERMAEWKPGQKLERVTDPVAALKAKLMTMTDEEKQAMLAELMG